MCTATFGDMFDQIDSAFPSCVWQLAELFFESGTIFHVAAIMGRKQQIVVRLAELIIRINLKMLQIQWKARIAGITTDKKVCEVELKANWNKSIL